MVMLVILWIEPCHGISVLRPPLDRGFLDAEDVVIVFFGPGTLASNWGLTNQLLRIIMES